MIASAFYLSPYWTAMPHLSTCFIMAAALFVGEMLRTALQTTFGAWLLANQKGARRRRGADADSAAQVRGWAGSIYADTAHDEPPLRDMAQLQRWLTTTGNCSLSEVRFDPVSLCFDSAEVELFYAARMFQLGHTCHQYACAVAVCICAIGGMSSVAMWPVAAVVLPYTCALAHSRTQLRGWASVPDAHLAFCSWATSAGVAAGAVHVVATLAGVTHSLSAACAPLLRHLQQRYRVLTFVAGLDDEAPDSLTLLCLCLLLFLCGVYLRVQVLTPCAKMGLRCVILACVVASHTDVARHDLSPTFVSSTVLAVCILTLGELVGYSIEQLRRNLFQDWLVQAQATEKANQADQAKAREIEEKNAELAADSRLNHVIKGRCGSAIAAISTFRMVVEPYLRCELPEELELMLKATLVHLTEAVEWYHRREVFVQLESGTYVSHRTPVDVLSLLELSLGSVGSVVSCSFDHPLAVDVTVLKVALDEILSNALKYRKLRSKIHVDASFALAELTLKVTNHNRPGMPPLSLEECKRVMQPGYKSNMASAMSDGLGLDSLAIAVAAAGGAAKLSCDAEAATTTLHVRLPADAMRRQGSQPHMDLSSSNGLYAMRGVPHPAARVNPSGRNGRRGAGGAAPPSAAEVGGSSGTRDAEPSAAGLALATTAASSQPDTAPVPLETGTTSALAPPAAAPAASAAMAVGPSSPAVARRPWADGQWQGVTSDFGLEPAPRGWSAGGSEGSSSLHGQSALASRGSSSGPSRPGLRDREEEQSDRQPRVLNGSAVGASTAALGPHQPTRQPTRGQPSCFQERSREHPFASNTPSLLLQSGAVGPPVWDARPPAAEGGPAQRESGASQPGSPHAGWRAYPRAYCGWVRRLSQEGFGTEQGAPRRLRRALTPTVLARGAASPSASVRDRTLRCSGIDDEGMPRMILALICEHYLCAKTAVLLGETSEQAAAFVDVVMGKLNPDDLSPATGPPSQCFDVAFIDQNLDFSGTLPVLGTDLCAQLRSAGFTGITVVLSGAASAQLDEIRLLPQVDLAFETGFALPAIALAIQTLYDERHNAQPELPLLDAPRARSFLVEADRRRVPSGSHKAAICPCCDGAPQTGGISMIIGRS